MTAQPKTTWAWMNLAESRDPFQTGVAPFTAAEAAEWKEFMRYTKPVFWPLKCNGRRIVLAEDPIPWRLPDGP